MLVFDGDCGFCTTTARWFERHFDHRSPVTVVAWQATDLDRIGLTVDQVTTAAYWIDDDGRPHRGHAAVARALTTMGGPWAAAGWLVGHRPVSWLADPVYRLVARYRHRMPGSTDACRIDDATR